MRRRFLQYGIPGAVFVTALVTWGAASARLTTPQEIPVGPPIVVTRAYVDTTDGLRRRETLSHMLARHNIEGLEMLQLLEVARPLGLNPRRISRSKLFEFRYRIGSDRPDGMHVRSRSTGSSSGR